VKNSCADPPARDRIVSDGGEPYMAIGRLLAEQYEPIVRDPVPESMLVLLAMIKETQGSWAR
jgi:hypothetical protein